MSVASASRSGLDDLIGAIYDCVIDPSLWHDVLERIVRRYNFHNAILAVHNTISRQMLIGVSVNLTDEYVRIADERSTYLGELWGGWARINAVPLEDPRCDKRLPMSRSDGTSRRRR